MDLFGFFRRRKRRPGYPAHAVPQAPVRPAAAVHEAAATGPAPQAAAQDASADPPVTQEQVIDVLRTVYDPEIPVNIFEMGLIYGLHIDPSGTVVVQMTLTSPACPVAGSLPAEVENKVLSLPGVKSAYVDLVWDPPWGPERMSEAAKLQLGMF
ncbi:MAG: DUF59 domain-containing protein [Acidobacteria bacterium]|nr:DUF59 domain-containing protein [Acidobacteriota bacterium]